MTDHISVVVAGDFCPTEHAERAVEELDQPADVLGPAVKLFQRADLAIANLEYPLTKGETKLTKYGSHQKGDPKTIAVLKQAGIGLVDLANNHILDYGEKGLADTLEVCSQAGIATVGAGLTPEEAAKPYYATVRERRIAIIGICENEFSIVGEKHAGACPLDPIANYYAIKKAREDADIVLVLLHGGNEFTHYPSPRVIRTCRFLADIGASAVVCHHPHYVQGCEVHNGVPILYSLGKLYYTRMDDPDILEVPIAQLDFAPQAGGCSIHFHFFRLSLEQMKLVELSAEELGAARDRFADYSEALGSPERIRAEWNRFCAEERHSYLFGLFLLPRLIARIARRLRVEHWVGAYAKLKRREMLCLQNMIRCEAHRDAVLDVLEKERSG